jgi:hypothetical protein
VWFGAKAQSSGLSMKACEDVVSVVKTRRTFMRIRLLVVIAAG